MAFGWSGIEPQTGEAAIRAGEEKSRPHSGFTGFACNMGASRARGRSAARQREVTNRAETIGGHATMKKTVTVIHRNDFSKRRSKAAESNSYELRACDPIQLQ